MFGEICLFFYAVFCRCFFLLHSAKTTGFSFLLSYNLGREEEYGTYDLHRCGLFHHMGHGHLSALGGRTACRIYGEKKTACGSRLFGGGFLLSVALRFSEKRRILALLSAVGTFSFPCLFSKANARVAAAVRVQSGGFLFARRQCAGSFYNDTGTAAIGQGNGYRKGISMVAAAMVGRHDIYRAEIGGSVAARTYRPQKRILHSGHLQGGQKNGGQNAH